MLQEGTARSAQCGVERKTAEHLSSHALPVVGSGEGEAIKEKRAGVQGSTLEPEAMGEHSCDRRRAIKKERIEAGGSDVGASRSAAIQ